MSATTNSEACDHIKTRMSTLTLVTPGETESLLIAACLAGDYQEVQDLLLKGHNPNVSDDKLRTCVHLCAVRGRDDLLALLIDAGADLTVTDYLGNTPLHYCGHTETIQCLVDAGSNLLARNRHGDTPLTLMKRRGVEKPALELMNQMLKEASERRAASEDATEPLLGSVATRRGLHRRMQPLRGLQAVQSLWLEFCTDLGAVRLVVVILVVLVLSLYVAYFATGIAKQIDTRIPVTVEKAEL